MPELLAGALFEDAVAVGVEEVLEFRNLGEEFAAFVGVADAQAATAELHNLLAGDDVGASADGVVGTLEGFVLDELETAAVEDEGVAGDAGGVVVGFGEAAVDDHEATVGLDGTLAAGHAYGDMAVDDVTVLALDTEGVEDAVTDFGIVAKEVVVTLAFFVG